jgi:membrane fusion protein, multidrug efflux system
MSSSSPIEPTVPAVPEAERLDFELPAPARVSRVGVIVVAAVVVGGAFAIGYLRRDGGDGGERASIAGGAGRKVRVEVIKPNPLASDRAIALPGTVRPLEETQLYARVTGYVRSWKVDLGDKVTAGQLLAEIDTPDVDAQLAQARAQLAVAQAAVTQAAAQRDYSRSNTARYQTLSDQRLVSKAQVEQTQAQAATDEATVSSTRSGVVAAEANVRRLADLQRFARITAPFAGTITTRAIERGALVRDSGTTPLFTLVATDPVRVFINVPQSIAPSVRSGVAASVTAREYGGRTFTGTVARAAGALDPEQHTMSTELRIPNPDGALLPGMYVQAALTLPVPHRVLEVPATALYNDSQGLRVAVVERGDVVRFAPITIERDTGATLVIGTGLQGDERVVKIAVPTLQAGESVEVVAAAPPAK